MNKILTLLIIMFFLASCKQQEYESGQFDLSKLNFNLNVNKFYSKSMNRENIKFTSGKQYVEKDTINEEDRYGKRDKSKIFAIQYRVVGYSQKDTVAIYKNLIFSRLQSMTSENDNLMLMSATGKCTEKEFKDAIEKLTTEYQNPTFEEREFSFFKTYHYTWRLSDRLIQLVGSAKVDFEQSPHNILTEKEKKEIITIEKDRLQEIHLYICKTDYEKRLRGNLYSGEWSDFK